MTLTFHTFIGLVVFWLSLCCLCGLKGRYLLCLALMFFGIAMNSIWLSAFLKVPSLAHQALMVHGAGVTCAAIAFLVGRFLGRIQDAWRDSRV